MSADDATYFASKIASRAGETLSAEQWRPPLARAAKATFIINSGDEGAGEPYLATLNTLAAILPHEAPGARAERLTTALDRPYRLPLPDACLTGMSAQRLIHRWTDAPLSERPEPSGEPLKAPTTASPGRLSGRCNAIT